MRSLPVHWYEGMFLRPHHMQASDRFWSDALDTSERWDHHYNYGLRTIELSKEALANGQVQVSTCEARLPDGSLVTIGAGQDVDRIELSEAFEKETTVRVFLGVPKLLLGRGNVAQEPGGSAQRFTELAQEFQDESRGGNEQAVHLKAMNVRLLLSTEDHAGFEVLPIGQVERAGESEAAPQLDESYIPPLLACDAWPTMHLQILRAIYDIIGKKIEVLSSQVTSRGISLSSQEPGDTERVLMLFVLNTAYARLRVIAFSHGVHPWIAYLELCELAGQLGVFRADRRPPEIPQYDHDDLGKIFYLIKQHIESSMDFVVDFDYERRMFVGSGLSMEVKLESKWFSTDWTWYVGVNKGQLSENECKEVLSKGQLDWKLGSSRQVEVLFKLNAPGLNLVKLDRPPRALPASGEWIYYEVSRDSAAWQDVEVTQTLAIRMKEAHIVNRDSLSGQQELIVTWQGRKLPLEFALFAVPKKT